MKAGHSATNAAATPFHQPIKTKIKSFIFDLLWWLMNGIALLLGLGRSLFQSTQPIQQIN